MTLPLILSTLLTLAAPTLAEVYQGSIQGTCSNIHINANKDIEACCTAPDDYGGKHNLTATIKPDQCWAFYAPWAVAADNGGIMGACDWQAQGLEWWITERGGSQYEIRGLFSCDNPDPDLQPWQPRVNVTNDISNFNGFLECGTEQQGQTLWGDECDPGLDILQNQVTPEEVRPPPGSRQ